MKWKHAGLWIEPSHDKDPINPHWTRAGQLEARCDGCGFALVAFGADGRPFR